MLFDSSFRKELGRSFGATLVVLITVVMTVMLIRTLGQASVGRVNPSEVLLVMGLTVLGHLPTILTLSLFVTITLVLTRMYASSEMVIWFACGQGLGAFVRPLLRFAWPVLLAVAALALLAWPWSNQQIQDLRERFQGRGDIERVAPGRFIESAGGQRVFFIDKDSAEADSGTNIFIAASERGSEAVISAERGHLVTLGEGRALQLDQGFRLQTNDTTGAMRVSEFAEYSNRINAQIIPTMRDDAPRLQSSLALLRSGSPPYLAELSWRLGLLLAAINCVLIALAVTRVNPRVGRSAGLVFSLFAFATYYNLIGLGQGWIEQGRVGAWAFMLGLHGGIALAAGAWMAWRQRNWHVRANREAQA
ncbi:LPS export ABC transporter permease LptF [Ottowia pentelensis]|uniref:Lipopolysaccharide export system permease protein LptF n=2 Tax=Ottowia pentelensis TaxID=511108 RepID=A0ABV6PX62_9BURK